MKLNHLFLCIGTVLVSTAFSLPAHAARLALVIGNDSYQKISTLKNARNDAKLIADVLKRAGFEVTYSADLNLDKMWDIIDNFKGRIHKGDEVVFYFAGHGVQIKSNQLLLPIDMVAQNDEQVQRKGVSLVDVQEALKDARMALLLIDACRNNPFPQKSGTRTIGGGTRGLLPPEPSTGQVVMMSAGRNQEALDSIPGKESIPNGLFAYELARTLKTPGLEIRAALRQVKDSVDDQAKTIGHEQRPSVVDDLRGDFCFISCNPNTQPPVNRNTIVTESISTEYKVTKNEDLNFTITPKKNHLPEISNTNKILEKPPEFDIGEKWTFIFHNIGDSKEPYIYTNQVYESTNGSGWLYVESKNPESGLKNFIHRFDYEKMDIMESFEIENTKPITLGKRFSNNLNQESLIQPPLIIGKKYKVKRIGSFSNYEYEAKVEIFEKIKVEAGIFEAYRIQFDGFWHRTDGKVFNGSAQQTLWYAPSVKRIIKAIYIDRTSSNLLYNKTSMELIKYEKELPLPFN